MTRQQLSCEHCVYNHYCLGCIGNKEALDICAKEGTPTLVEGYDYDYLPGCEYPVYSARNVLNGFEEPCGAPAVYKVWWTVDGTDSMCVCEKHMGAIRKEEGRQ